MSRYPPSIGQWFQEVESGQVFEIVAYDRDEATVQVQYLDGEIADFDLDSWAQLELSRAAEPEDWRSAFELDDELRVDPDAAMHPVQWSNPLSRVEPDTVLGIDDY